MYKNNKFKESASTWSKITCNSPIRIYVNKIENKITFKIKTGCYLELLTPEMMKLLGSTENKINKNENGENVPNLEITEVVLAHCNIINNSYEENSRVLYTFVPNTSFGQLLDISPRNFIILKIFNDQRFHISNYGLLIKILNH